LDRRELLLSVSSLVPIWFVTSKELRNDNSETAAQALAKIEKRLGGRLGVAAWDTGTGKRMEHRVNERFPMCSTFKFLAVAAILSRVDTKGEKLDRLIHYRKDDLLEYAPITKKHVQQGMTLSALCAAAMQYSDNTAANLLLAALGGPDHVTATLVHWAIL
jgi:beta-lactamase class A